MWNAYINPRKCIQVTGMKLTPLVAGILHPEYRGREKISYMKCCQGGGWFIRTPDDNIGYWPTRFEETDCRKCHYYIPGEY